MSADKPLDPPGRMSAYTPLYIAAGVLVGVAMSCGIFMILSSVLSGLISVGGLWFLGRAMPPMPH